MLAGDCIGLGVGVLVGVMVEIGSGVGVLVGCGVGMGVGMGLFWPGEVVVKLHGELLLRLRRDQLLSVSEPE